MEENCHMLTTNQILRPDVYCAVYYMQPFIDSARWFLLQPHSSVVVKVKVIEAKDLRSSSSAGMTVTALSMVIFCDALLKHNSPLDFRPPVFF